MWLHWEDDGYAESLAGLIWMRDNWNLSVIRAAMGIEPDGAYLTDPDQAREQATTIVENAIQAGVYVIIDWHDHNAHEHQSQAQAFFADMAEAYGNTPNVIYEPYNEPLQEAWDSVIKPYHEALVGTIRAADPDNLIILGTPNWSQYVDEAAANPVSGANLLYTLHFYTCSHDAWLRDLGDAALNLGAPLFVTEWGATDADGGLDGQVCLEEAQLWHNWLNQHNISWTAWKLDGCEDSSCYFGPDGAPLEGGWSDEYLYGHAPFVRDRMRE
jgi:endoglucanase